MPRIRIAAAISALCFVVAVDAANASSIDAIYAFGDSLTDNGNDYQALGGAFPMPPYYNGRFSNGPVWVEDVAAASNVPLHDFAYGGATSGTGNLINAFLPAGLPGLSQEISGYLAGVGGHADPQALYVVWAGANDYLGGETNPTVPVGNIISEISALAAAGADRFLIPNLPDLGLTPFDAPFAAQATLLSQAHDALLASALTQLSFGLGPMVMIQSLDVYSLLNAAVAHPASFGLTNVTDPCYTTMAGPPGSSGVGFGGGTACADPDSYLFWDVQHPTAIAHQFVADAALEALPEPGSLILVGAGLAVLGMIVRRRSGT